MTSEELDKKYLKCPPAGTWLRHKDTGDLAQVIDQDGERWIKPNIPGSPTLYPATMAHKFNIESQPKRLPPGSWARVAYEADRALCDIHPDMRKTQEWISLNPMTRAAWIEARMELNNPLRIKLYTAIIKVLEEHQD